MLWDWIQSSSFPVEKCNCGIIASICIGQKRKDTSRCDIDTAFNDDLMYRDEASQKLSEMYILEYGV